MCIVYCVCILLCVHVFVLRIVPCVSTGFDHNGSLLFVSNRLQLFTQGLMMWDDINFRIWKVFIDADSYLD
jgi:hypothetical protein